MREKRLTRWAVVGVVVVLLVGQVGVGATFAEQDEQEDGESRVRAMHISPFLPSLDVLVEGEPVIENMSFGDVSDYESFEAGEGMEIEIINNESGESIFETEATLEAGVNFTVLAVGTIEDRAVQFQPALLRDGFQIPSRENASIRFIHGVPDAPPLDLTLQGENRTVAENVTYRDDGPYVTLPPGNYTLEVRRTEANGTGDVLETRNVTLEGGSVNSAIGLGFLNPDDFNVSFGLAVALSEDIGPPEANETTTTTAAS